MKHTWVVLDLARIIPHPRLSSTHRANTATHVEQTHTRDSVYTVNEEIYGCTSASKSSHASIAREKKEPIPPGKNYSRRMCLNLTLKILYNALCQLHTFKTGYDQILTI